MLRRKVSSRQSICRYRVGLIEPLIFYLGGTAEAQDSFPDRPITIVVPAQPAGSSDVLFRKLAAEAEAITRKF